MTFEYLYYPRSAKAFVGRRVTRLRGADPVEADSGLYAFAGGPTGLLVDDGWRMAPADKCETGARYLRGPTPEETRSFAMLCCYSGRRRWSLGDVPVLDLSSGDLLELLRKFPSWCRRQNFDALFCDEQGLLELSRRLAVERRACPAVSELRASVWEERDGRGRPYLSGQW